MNGFKTMPCLSLEYSCREMGKKSRYEYYGYANYYRGITLSYCFLKGLNYIRIGQYENGFRFVRGYLQSYIGRKEKISDKEILKYFRGMLGRKLNSFFTR